MVLKYSDLIRNDLPRLIQAVNYSERMKRAGVPDKNRRKILRQWEPFAYYVRQEIQGIIQDMRQRRV